MKIGVLTYHNPANFGAQLQVISVVGYLRSTGHTPVVIDWTFEDLEEAYRKNISSEQMQIHKDFAKNLPLSAPCHEEQELIKIIDDLNLDMIIAGSDALFKYTTLHQVRYFKKRALHYIYNPRISCEVVEGNPFFGGFIPKLKNKVTLNSYAVSSQNARYMWMTKKERKVMADALSNFNKITVRDEWTKQMVRHITGRDDINIYPDPVFSFNQNCYIPVPTKEDIVRRYGLQPEYIIISFGKYFVDAGYVKTIAEEVQAKGYQPVALPMPEGHIEDGIPTHIPQPLSPIDWYALIIHSSGYIGERMHPIVVCLHNVVPFFSYDEYGFLQKKHWFAKEDLVYSSSKTYQILEEAGLLGNIYSYKGGQELPEVSQVVSKVLSFNHDKCRQFSIRKQKKVVEGLESILNN